MRFALVCLVLAVSAILAASGYPEESHSAALDTPGPYLGQELPGEVPVVFAPGIVSLPAYTEFSGTFASNDSEYYFYRFSEVTTATIYQCVVVDSGWTAPEPVDFSAGYPAFEPCITYDNASLYFNWQRGSTLPEVWVTTRESAGWTEPQRAGQGMFVSSDSMGNIYVTDMSSLYIDGKTYLAKVTLNNGLFESYQRINISAHYGAQAHPCIARDGSYIIFDVQGGSYMYVSFRKPDGTWDVAIDLTAHGFDPSAGGATLSPDGKYLFFFLNGDIWWVDAQVIEKLRPAVVCCDNTEGRGNVDCSTADNDWVDISDLTRLIDFLFLSYSALCCEQEADLDGATGVDVGDLTRLIDYLFITATPLPGC